MSLGAHDSACHRCTVLVPDGCRPGDEMLIDVDGMLYTLAVPAGLMGGQPFEVSVPCKGLLAIAEQYEEQMSRPASIEPPGIFPGDDTLAEEQIEEQSSRPASIDVVIPEGLFPGDEFFVECECDTFAVSVPIGYAAGEDLNVQLPSLASEFDEDPVMEAELGEEPMPPTWTNNSSECNSSEGSGKGDEDMLFPSSRMFIVGMHVQVYRSNGSWSTGRIDAKDAASETYTIRMEDGRVKYLVEECDILPERAGAYFMGAVVSVARERQGRQLVMRAAISEYDEESETYSVMLPSGELLYFVQADEIIE